MYLHQLRDMYMESKKRRTFYSQAAIKEVRCTLVGEDIGKQVQAYLMKLCDIGGMVNGTIARASAKSIISISNKLLARNGA